VRVVPHDLAIFPNAFGQGASVAYGEVSICADGPGTGRVLEVGLGQVRSTGKMVAAPSGTLYVQTGEVYRLVSARHRLKPAELRNVWARPPHAAPRAEVFAKRAIASMR